MAPLKAEILRADFSVSTEPIGTSPNGPIPDTLLKTSLQFILYLDSSNFTMASIVIESTLKLEFLHALLQIKPVPLGRD